MSIEFYCDECYQKVTTPDSTAGKKGRCPHCQQVINIPRQSQPSQRRQSGPAASAGARAAAPHPGPPAPPLGQADPMSSGIDPLGAGALAPRDPGWREAEKAAQWGDFSKEESQLRQKELQRFEARKVLAVPAVGMIICSIVGMLATAGYVVVLSLTATMVMAQEELNPAGLVVHSVLVVVNVAILSMIVIGANHMRLTRNFSLAIAGAVMCFLPSFTCLFSAPFGVWALILLSKREIRNAFKRF